jgi:hypothetical protein
MWMKFGATVGLVAALVLASQVAWAASDTSRATYRATGLSGHPELHAGGVVDVTYGRDAGSREVHHVHGAGPNTVYAVTGDVYFATACAPDDPFGPVTVPEGELATDSSGNGRLAVRFPGSAFTGAPDALWVRWNLSTSQGVAYQTECVLIELGS